MTSSATISLYYKWEGKGPTMKQNTEAVPNDSFMWYMLPYVNQISVGTVVLSSTWDISGGSLHVSVEWRIFLQTHYLALDNQKDSGQTCG